MKDAKTVEPGAPGATALHPGYAVATFNLSHFHLIAISGDAGLKSKLEIIYLYINFLIQLFKLLVTTITVILSRAL